MRKMRRVMAFLAGIVLATSAMLSAVAMNWDGSSAGGGGGGTSSGNTGYSVMTTGDNVVGYRFSLVTDSGATRGSNIDVYRNAVSRSYYTNNVSPKKNKLQYVQNGGGSYSTGAYNSNCYSESAMGFLTTLPAPSGLETWQSKDQNLNAVLAKINEYGATSVDLLTAADKILVEPIFAVEIAGESLSMTVSEMASFGAYMLGGSSTGAVGGKGTWGFIAAYTNQHYPNALFTPDGEGLWPGVSATSSKLTFTTMRTTGYGVGIAYSNGSPGGAYFEPPIPVLMVEQVDVHWETPSSGGSSTNRYGYSTGETFSKYHFDNDYVQAEKPAHFSVKFTLEDEEFTVRQYVQIDDGPIYTRDTLNSDDVWWLDFYDEVVPTTKEFYIVTAWEDWIDDGGEVQLNGYPRAFYIPVRPTVYRTQVTAYSVTGDVQATNGDDGQAGKMYCGQRVVFDYLYRGLNTWDSYHNITDKAERWNGTEWEAIASGSIAYRIGDIDGNGLVEQKDLDALYAHIYEEVPITDDKALVAADVNFDDEINMDDATRLVLHLNGTAPLYVAGAYDYSKTNQVISASTQHEGVSSLGLYTVPIIAIMGDMNGDNQVTEDDLLLMNAYLAGEQELTEKQTALFDVNHDGKKDAADAQRVQDYLDEKVNTVDTAESLQNSSEFHYMLGTAWVLDTARTVEERLLTLPVCVPDVELVEIRLVDESGNYVDSKELHAGQNITIQYVYRNNTDCTVYVNGYNTDKDLISNGGNSIFTIPAGETINVNDKTFEVPNKRTIEIWGGVFLEGAGINNTEYESDGTNNTKTLECKVAHPLTIEPILPNAPYREGTNVITSYWVHNEYYGDYKPENAATVRFRVYGPDESLLYETTKASVIVPGNESNLFYYCWTIPEGLESQDVQIYADIYEDGAYYNEVHDTYATIPYETMQTHDTQYEESAPRDFHTPGEEETPHATTATATWWQWEYIDEEWVKKEYGLSLVSPVVSVAPSKSPSAYIGDDNLWHMKSGYGISVAGAVQLDTPDDFEEAPLGSYVKPQYSYALWPEFLYEVADEKATTMEREEVKLDSLIITHQPTKTYYKVGEMFDPAGMEVTAIYTDGSSKVVTNYTMQYTGPFTASQTYVLIVYEENGVRTTAVQKITVENPVISIECTTPPNKSVYIIGENFDRTGMVITATFLDGSTLEVKRYDVPDGTHLKIEQEYITVVFVRNEQTVTCQVPIEVITPPNLTLKPNTTWYRGNTEKAEITGIKLVDTYYADGTELENWKADVAETGHIRCYVTADKQLVIAGNGSGILYANKDSQKVFAEFPAAESIGNLTLLEPYCALRMDSAFAGDNAVTDINIQNWRTPRISTMAEMFKDCKKLYTLDLSSMSMTKCETASGAFAGAETLAEVTLGEDFVFIGTDGYLPVPNPDTLIPPEGYVVTGKWYDHNIVSYLPTAIPNNVAERYVAYTAKADDLSVIVPPDKVSYLHGDDFDTTGMVVQVTYSDGRKQVVTDYTMEPAENLTYDVTSILITYTENGVSVSTTQPVYVKAILDKIEVTTPPNKTEYVHGEDFDPKGMVVTAFYVDGTTKRIYDYTITGGEAMPWGTPKVTISYTEDGITKTCTQPVGVLNPVISLEITTMPIRLVYNHGENFDPTGMVLQATYKDGTTENVTALCNILDGFPISYDDGATQNIEIQFTDRFNFTVSCVCPIEVHNPAASIEVTSPPYKTVYDHGDAFDWTGMNFLVTFANGSERYVTLTEVLQSLSGAGFANHESLEYGQTSVNVAYTDEYGYTVTTIQPITVTNSLVAIEITTPPTKTEYFTGDDFDPTGMVVKAIYKNGDSRTIDGYVLSNDKSLYYGQTAVTVSFTENEITRSTTQAITVRSPLKSICVKTAPTTTRYNPGDNFNTAGMVIEATYENGSTKIISKKTDVSDGYIVTNGTNLTLGQTSVTISYTEGPTKTTTQAISVKPILSSITITKNPSSIYYDPGDRISISGITVLATYSDGSTKTLSASDLTYTPKTASGDGEWKTVTVKYTDDGVTKSDTYSIYVYEEYVPPTPPVTHTHSYYTKVGETYNQAQRSWYKVEVCSGNGCYIGTVYTKGTQSAPWRVFYSGDLRPSQGGPSWLNLY